MEKKKIHNLVRFFFSLVMTSSEVQSGNGGVILDDGHCCGVVSDKAKKEEGEEGESGDSGGGEAHLRRIMSMCREIRGNSTSLIGGRVSMTVLTGVEPVADHDKPTSKAGKRREMTSGGARWTRPAGRREFSVTKPRLIWQAGLHEVVGDRGERKWGS